MSWTGYVTAPYEKAVEAVGDIAVSPDSTAPEQVEQVEAAKAAAVSIIESGKVVNDPSQDVAVTISGHANPAHKPTAGYGNDTVSVTVSQVSRQAADA